MLGGWQGMEFQAKVKVQKRGWVQLKPKYQPGRAVLAP